MKTLKKTMVGMLAFITACGMMSAAVFAEEAPEEAAVQEQEAGAAEEIVEEADPIEGSWVLYQVFEMKEGEAPVLLDREENNSLYGSGIGVFTFDQDGVAHHNMIDGGDNLDNEASWTFTEPDVYTCTEGEESMELQYVADDDTLHRTFSDGSRNLDFVYARAMVGSWKLDRVIEVHEGDAPTELPKEENQALYGAGESILTFNPDGTANDEIIDGEDKTVVNASWELTAPDQFTYTEDGLEMEFHYFRADDTIFRDLKDESPDAVHPALSFIYVRVFPEPKAEEKETTKAAQPETKKDAKPKRTGYSIDLVLETGGDAITIFELEDFSYEDDYGITYTQEAGGGEHWYGSDGSVWVFPDVFDSEESGGKIFTGFEMDLYDPETQEKVTVKELTQGGWAVEETGVVYTQEEGGGDHYYGDDGSVLISEWLFFEGANDDVDDDSIVDDVVEDELIEEAIVDDEE